MKRRDLLVGAGSLTAGSIAIVGSGAFASVDANREFDVRVAEDDNAYLRLQPIKQDFAREENGSLKLTFDGDFTNTVATDGDIESEDLGDGVGTDSVYTFDDVFIVKNQGTNPMQVFGVYQSGEVNNIGIYDSDDSSRDELTEESPSAVLGPGDSLAAGVIVNTHGTPVAEDPYQESLIIGADAE